MDNKTITLNDGLLKCDLDEVASVKVSAHYVNETVSYSYTYATAAAQFEAVNSLPSIVQPNVIYLVG